MTTNPTYNCPFCDSKITYNYIFKHFLNIHKNELFDSATPHGKLNRLKLGAMTSHPKPMTIELPSKSSLMLSGCFGCMLAVKSPKWAVKHYPKCCKQATENIKKIKTDLGLPVVEETRADSELSSLSSPSSPSSVSTPSLDPELEVFYLRTIKHLLAEVEESKKKLRCWNRASEAYLEGDDLRDLKEKVECLEMSAHVINYDMINDPEFLGDSEEMPVYEEIIKQARATRF